MSVPFSPPPTKSLRRFPEKGEEIPPDSEEESFARDILDCATIEDAHALARRVLNEWKSFWRSC